MIHAARRTSLGDRVFLPAIVLVFSVEVAQGQYSSLHLPYSINYERDVLQTPSRMEIYEKFFQTLSYAAEENELNNTDSVPLEFLLLLQRISYDFAGVRDTFETGITNMETCSTCRSLLGLLSNMKRFVNRNVFFRGLGFTCQWFKLNTPGVCAGLIDKYRDEVDFIMDEARKRQISVEDSCTLVFGPACGTLSSEYHIWDMEVTERANSTGRKLSLSSLIAQKQIKAESGDTYGILHISDTHFDPEYQVGSLANCSEPLCCQKASGEPTGPESEARAWGDYRRCDLPQQTLENMLQYIQSNMSEEMEFAYWTGDLPAHDLWKLTEQSNEFNFNLTSELLKKYFWNGRFRVFPTVGNHESVPPNMFTRTTESKPGEPDPKFLKKTQKLYDFLWESWKQWLPAEAEENFRKHGYYTARPRKGLKVISLNTNYCYYFNLWLLLDSRDAAGQLAWLDRELFESEQAGEAVHIIGHVPPGLADCIETWSRGFHSIVERYQDTIKAQFYGHTHYDEFIVYFDKETRAIPINVAYIGPSVTTYSFLNPSFRIYRSNQLDHRIEDHETYILNLTDANLNDRGIWFKEYSARADLNLTALSPAEWNNYVNRMAQQPEEFESFYTRFLHSSDQDFPCDQRCARRQLCRMKTDIAHDYRPCGSNSSGLLDTIMNMNVSSLGIDEMILSNVTTDTREGDLSSFWTMFDYLQQSVASFFPSFYIAHNSPLQRIALRDL
ncbi:sphingomyelin phosphodiesterase [Galendromus occidentalis]|uniref:Sphingomyelin phosphodiesterase n=1 Tax=Galendromus occidentalis TaxID=34638 RepID=A0AAJ6QN58_9ACAR|nr:sphingomyelin phosphodiesterase [Galendromus occidentalis]